MSPGVWNQISPTGSPSGAGSAKARPQRVAAPGLFDAVCGEQGRGHGIVPSMTDCEDIALQRTECALAPHETSGPCIFGRHATSAARLQAMIEKHCSDARGWANGVRPCVPQCPARSRLRSSPHSPCPSPGCARKAGKNDLPYVARDVGTLYSAAKDRLDQGQYKDAAALFDEVERQHPYSVWARRAQLMSAFSYYLDRDYTEFDRVGAALPRGPSGQPRRALCLLSDRAQLLRADQRRDARPEDHAAGARFARRTDAPLSRTRAMPPMRG